MALPTTSDVDLTDLYQYLDTLSDADLAEYRTSIMIQLARSEDSPRSFAAFYQLIHGRELPEHCRTWIDSIYGAHTKGRGIVIEAFRGSGKTTAVTITFTAYRIGKSPEKSNLLVQVGDDMAADNTAAIARIISENPGWRMVFPSVVPGDSWGAGGYNVKRIDIPPDEWALITSDRKDPTLLGAGYKSGEIIGKRPTGVLLIDDIQDEINTSSSREMKKMMDIVTGTIFPTVVNSTWEIFIGTPWNENDVLHYVVATGIYDHVKTPVYTETSDGVIYTWPDLFGPDEVSKRKRLSGVQFGRMYILDLKATKNTVMKYMSFPNQAVSFSWPISGGLDYASHRDAARNVEGKGDYFAMCYLAKHPNGGAVVIGGVLEHLTQAEGEQYVVAAQETLPMYLATQVEAVGKGDDFFQLLMRKPHLRIVPHHPGNKSKTSRLEKELQPLLQYGIIRISDAETPFLNELRRELDTFPFHEHDDAMDALYYAIRGFPEVLALPNYDENDVVHGKKTKNHSPFAAFGRK